jgi:hypothetical protein
MVDKASSSEGTLGLAVAVQALRKEIQGAMLAGDSEQVRFELAPIELTLQAVVTKGADGKIGWKILEFGAKYESAVTQTVKLTLNPMVTAAQVVGGRISFGETSIGAPVLIMKDSPGD